MAYLAAEVKKVLAATGAKKVVLVGNSRGGYAIRNFVANGNAALVSHVVLGDAEPWRLGEANRDAKALVTLTRPRPERHRRRLDGARQGGRCGAAAIVGTFNDERIVGRTWPVAENHVVVLELTY